MNCIEKCRCQSYNSDVLLEERDSLGWVLKALREAGGQVVYELAGVDEETLCRRPGDGDWCLKEIAAHLRDAEELALCQMTAIAQGATAAIPFWDVDVLPSERDYRAADLSDLLTEVRARRHETTLFLWGLSETDWQSSAEHPYRGPMTLEAIARELAQHDLEHLWQVRRMKFELGSAARG